MHSIVTVRHRAPSKLALFHESAVLFALAIFSKRYQIPHVTAVGTRFRAHELLTETPHEDVIGSLSIHMIYEFLCNLMNRTFLEWITTHLFFHLRS